MTVTFQSRTNGFNLVFYLYHLPLLPFLPSSPVTISSKLSAYSENYRVIIKRKPVAQCGKITLCFYHKLLWLDACFASGDSTPAQSTEAEILLHPYCSVDISRSGSGGALHLHPVCLSN